MKPTGPQLKNSASESFIYLPDALGQVTRALSEVRELNETLSGMDEGQLELLSDRISKFSAQIPFHFSKDREISFAAERLKKCAEDMKRWDA